MLFCCTFYLQMLLMWLITPTDRLLAGGRKMEAIFRFSPPHLFSAAHLSISFTGESQRGCLFSELRLSREPLPSPLFFCHFVLSAHTPVHQHLGAVFKCITQELEDGAADRSSSLAHHLLHPRVSPAAAVLRLQNGR